MREGESVLATYAGEKKVIHVSDFVIQGLAPPGLHIGTSLYLPAFIGIEDQGSVKPNDPHKVVRSDICRACQHLRSKLTFIDHMDIVRLTSKVYRAQVDIPVNIAREIPIMPRICGPRPMYVNPCSQDKGKRPTGISSQNPRSNIYVVIAL